MNLTRRILEGIHEVELDIAPEFRKEPRREGAHFTELMDALIENGWKIASIDLSAPDKMTNTYYHPSLHGAAFVFSWDKGSGLVTDLASRSGVGTEPIRFDPGNIDIVAQLTNEWLEIGKKYKTAAEDEIADTVSMLAGIGWIMTSDTVIFAGGGPKARVFEHPKVGKKIRVAYSPKTGVITSVLVLQPDDSIIESIDASPASVYKEAQELMKEAGV